MQTQIDPFELACRVPQEDVASSLVAIDAKLEEDAMVDELGAELARRPGARMRVWCSED